MVTGIDEWFWTGYGFVDTYYHSEGSGESAEIFGNDPNQMDPLLCGRHELSRAIWDPREYFLRVLLCRMEQVKEEWTNVVSRLLQEIKPHVSGPMITSN